MLVLCLISALLFLEDGSAGESTPTGQSLHINDGNFSNRDHVKPDSIQDQQQQAEPQSDSAFNLKVQVNDVLSRQSLREAAVEVYVNYSRSTTARTSEDGSVLLRVPYQTGTPITIVASKDGYVCSLMPCRTKRMPIFSSVTLSLLGLNQGNIWLFNDSVLITGKTSDAVASRPTVQFPKSLLNLTDGRNFTSIKAFLTIPKLPTDEDGNPHTLGIMSTKSGYMSVELSPVAAVSVELFSGDSELHVTGSIRISLSVPDGSGLRASSVVPAWFFNRTTGGWMRKGLGTLVSVEGKLMWTFTAPHLGYWIAAPLSPTRGFFGLAVPIDFILNHSSLLMVILGGMLVIVICLLVGLLFYRSRPLGETKRKIPAAMKRDQTTSTCDVFELSADSHPQDGLNHSFTERGDNRHNAVISMSNGNVISNPNAVAIQCGDLELSADMNDLMCLREDQMTENLFFYNQPVAIFHAPAFFHLEEQPEQWSKSATLPRAGAGAAEPPSKDGFTQTQPKDSKETEELKVLEGSQASTSSKGHFGLPESASVPGTLSKIRRSGRHSVHTLAELSRAPPTQPPRAWFVSLEGKPAAEIHYAVTETQRRRRPVESRETSLDSGVDMSELNQGPGRRAVTLERNATFVKSTARKQAPPE